METDLLLNVRGNVRTLRTMWSEKVQEEQKSIQPKSVTNRAYSETSQKKLMKDNIQTPIATDETLINSKSKIITDSE
ncbi:unnamed protein product, partial [Rotaria sp. Silwood1]